MVDEDSPDSHSTDLSISGEEGHWTILLAHYMFWFEMRTKLFRNAGYTAKLHKNACTICIFSTRPKKVLFFRANFEQLSL